MKLIMILCLAALLVLAGCVQDCGSMSNYKDEHCCNLKFHETWCEAKQKCVREWEEPCNATLNLSEAKAIAKKSGCTDIGNLTNKSYYNNATKTWWLDLDAVKPGCSPACVVYENKSALVNWRCTGLIVPNATGCYKPCHIYIGQTNYTANPPECSNETMICTLEYRSGDICLRYIDCTPTNDTCKTTIDPEFNECISCFEDAVGNLTTVNECENRYGR